MMRILRQWLSKKRGRPQDGCEILISLELGLLLIVSGIAALCIAAMRTGS